MTSTLRRQSVSMLVGAAMSAALLCAGVSAGAAAQPGTIPKDYRGPSTKQQQISDPEATAGLQVIFNQFGKLRLSVSAAGSNNASHTIRVFKPEANAKVLKAYLMAASNFSTVINNGDIKFGGKPITWSKSVFNGLSGGSDTFFHNVLADVTSIVKPVMDGFNAVGGKNFNIVENSSKVFAIDGEILAVVYAVPTGFSQSVALLFGGQQLAGDRFELALDTAIDPANANAKLNMGLGISFSYQENGTQQYSIVNVNGKRLTTAAGGSDDGVPTNGGLITVGGFNDSLNRPLSPTATPTNAKSDDEKYSILQYITKTTKNVIVDTNNPSNDDNILFAWFEYTARGTVNKDTDGDGLLDHWEISGYEHNGDGKVDVNLPAMGFNYRKKDICIAYVWMLKGGNETKSHQVTAAIKNAINAAFARAPVSNPDGTMGIKFHWVDRGSIAYQANLNLTATNWAEFDTIMDVKVSAAMRKICHRMIAGRGYDGGNSSGLSRGIPASDFVETLHSNATTAQRAGTIMHELGHNLGLRHGGPDHENYKPNHLSIMSYANQFDWLIRDGTPFLDYERFRQRSLNENALNEAAGLSLVTGSETALNRYGVRWFTAGAGRVKTGNAGVNVNWNNSGAANQTNVAVDINNGFNNADSKTTLAANFSEWLNIVYNGGNIGASGGKPLDPLGSLPPNALKELSLEDHERTKTRTIEVK